jgi:hypothetical protein
MIPVETGFPRERLIRPEVMVAPLLYLIDDRAAAVSGRRLVAVEWDSAVSDEDADVLASTPVAWPDIGARTLWPGGKRPEHVSAVT